MSNAIKSNMFETVAKKIGGFITTPELAETAADALKKGAAYRKSGKTVESVFHDSMDKGIKNTWLDEKTVGSMRDRAKKTMSGLKQADNQKAHISLKDKLAREDISGAIKLNNEQIKRNSLDVKEASDILSRDDLELARPQWEKEKKNRVAKSIKKRQEQRATQTAESLYEDGSQVIRDYGQADLKFKKNIFDRYTHNSQDMLNKTLLGTHEATAQLNYKNIAKDVGKVGAITFGASAVVGATMEND